jgi:enamine deaminase RidA (YjgF/YER057c/UK114 family)
VKASELLFLAGQVGLDEDGSIVGPGDAGAQTRQAYDNIARILEAAGASLDDVVQITTYLVGRENLQSYLDARAALFDGVFSGGVGPPNTLVFVDALLEEEMLVEVAVAAALP